MWETVGWRGTLMSTQLKDVDAFLKEPYIIAKEGKPRTVQQEGEKGGSQIFKDSYSHS